MSGERADAFAAVKPGAIFNAAEISADIDLRCDVCVIGSGAGGAVLAAGLAERGLSVVMLEEGGHHTKREFDLQEGHAYPMLYQERGMRATADRAITILQGRAVGGSTVVNWTTCFRTPARDPRSLAPALRRRGDRPRRARAAFRRVEQRLNIAEWPLEQANANNRVLWTAAEASRLGGGTCSAAT